MNNTFVYSHGFLAAALQNVRSIDVSCFGGMSWRRIHQHAIGYTGMSSNRRWLHQNIVKMATDTSGSHQNDVGYVRMSLKETSDIAKCRERRIGSVKISSTWCGMHQHAIKLTSDTPKCCQIEFVCLIELYLFVVFDGKANTAYMFLYNGLCKHLYRLTG